jgi:hypothetical protein
MRLRLLNQSLPSHTVYAKRGIKGLGSLIVFSFAEELRFIFELKFYVVVRFFDRHRFCNNEIKLCF